MAFVTLVIIFGLTSVGLASGDAECSSSAEQQCETDNMGLLQSKVRTELSSALPNFEAEEHARMLVPGHPVSLQEHAHIMVDPAYQAPIAKPQAKKMNLPVSGDMDDEESGKAGTHDTSKHSGKKAKLSGSEKNKIEKILEHVGGADANEASKDMKAGEFTEKDREEVMKDLEKESVDTSVEDGLRRGTVITRDLIEDTLGLDKSGEENNGAKAVEGDMVAGSQDDLLLLQQEANAGLRFVPNIWSDNMNIPYCFSSNIAASSKKAFLDAVQHWKDKIPCLGFKQIAVGSESSKNCATLPSIFVFSSEPGQCFAHVGQFSGFSSQCHLGVGGCDNMGVAAHEIGHNLGMLHEQARADHNQYVKILWDNIEPANKNQYAGSTDADTTVEYDVMSLMHYTDTEFAKVVNGKKLKTMVFQGSAGSNKPMGNRQGLTFNDAKQAAKMYGCSDQLQAFKLCTGKGDGCSPSDCMCHQGGGLKKFKTGNNCYMCGSQCPDSPSGTTGVCGCPEGYEKACFTSGVNTYCGCKVYRPPDDTCQYAKDGGCDEPNGANPFYCQKGTDCTDCENCHRVTEAPVTSAPVTEAPVTSAPVTEAPVTEAPVTSAPVTEAPVTSAPVTSAPTDTCQHANDHECDEPDYCDPGTDCTDCNNCGAEAPTEAHTEAPTEAPTDDCIARGAIQPMSNGNCVCADYTWFEASNSTLECRDGTKKTKEAPTEAPTDDCLARGGWNSDGNCVCADYTSFKASDSTLECRDGTKNRKQWSP